MIGNVEDGHCKVRLARTIRSIWYKEHLFTPAQAVQQIKSGQRVVVAHACGEPSIILDALVANAAQYENVEIIHMVAMGKAAY